MRGILFCALIVPKSIVLKSEMNGIASIATSRDEHDLPDQTNTSFQKFTICICYSKVGNLLPVTQKMKKPNSDGDASRGDTDDNDRQRTKECEHNWLKLNNHAMHAKHAKTIKCTRLQYNFKSLSPLEKIASEQQRDRQTLENATKIPFEMFHPFLIHSD